MKIKEQWLVACVTRLNDKKLRILAVVPRITWPTDGRENSTLYSSTPHVHILVLLTQCSVNLTKGSHTTDWKFNDLSPGDEADNTPEISPKREHDATTDDIGCSYLQVTWDVATYSWQLLRTKDVVLHWRGLQKELVLCLQRVNLTRGGPWNSGLCYLGWFSRMQQGQCLGNVLGFPPEYWDWVACHFLWKLQRWKALKSSCSFVAFVTMVTTQYSLGNYSKLTHTQN